MFQLLGETGYVGCVFILTEDAGEGMGRLEGGGGLVFGRCECLFLPLLFS